MKRQLLFVSACAVALCTMMVTIGCDEDDGGTNPTAPTSDITGTWTSVSTNTQVVGVCPVGDDQQGTATIVQTGATFTVQMSGFTCVPTGVCSYTGTIDGDDYECESEIIPADDEGGTVQTSMEFTLTSDTTAVGTGGSVYSHPVASCSWSYDITLTKN